MRFASRNSIVARSPENRTAATSGSSNFRSGNGGSIFVSENRTWKLRSDSAVVVLTGADRRRTTWVVGATWTTATSTVTGRGPAGESVHVRRAGSQTPAAPATGKRIFSKKSAGA